jgi:hypothetical protein
MNDIARVIRRLKRQRRRLNRMRTIFQESKDGLLETGQHRGVISSLDAGFIRPITRVHRNIDWLIGFLESEFGEGPDDCCDDDE